MILHHDAQNQLKKIKDVVIVLLKNICGLLTLSKILF